MSLSAELRYCAERKPDAFTPHWVDAARRLMRQAADALDAAEQAVQAEYRLRMDAHLSRKEQP